MDSNKNEEILKKIEEIRFNFRRVLKKYLDEEKNDIISFFKNDITEEELFKNEGNKIEFALSHFLYNKDYLSNVKNKIINDSEKKILSESTYRKFIDESSHSPKLENLNLLGFFCFNQDWKMIDLQEYKEYKEWNIALKQNKLQNDKSKSQDIELEIEKNTQENYQKKENIKPELKQESIDKSKTKQKNSQKSKIENNTQVFENVASNQNSNQEEKVISTVPFSPSVIEKKSFPKRYFVFTAFALLLLFLFFKPGDTATDDSNIIKSIFNSGVITIDQSVNKTVDNDTINSYQKDSLIK